MIELRGDLWSVHSYYYIVIPTNGIVTNGKAVMGAGLAKQAADRYPALPAILGKHLVEKGNIPMVWRPLRIITFPTKLDWRNKSDIELIKSSAAFVSSLTVCSYDAPVFMPRVGCGLGGLRWDVVRPVLDRILDPRFIVIHNG